MLDQSELLQHATRGPGSFDGGRRFASAQRCEHLCNSWEYPRGGVLPVAVGGAIALNQTIYGGSGDAKIREQADEVSTDIAPQEILGNIAAAVRRQNFQLRRADIRRGVHESPVYVEQVNRKRRDRRQNATPVGDRPRAESLVSCAPVRASGSAARVRLPAAPS